MKITFRVWILIIAVLLSILAIRPTFESGAVVKSIEKNSSLLDEGLRAGDIIKTINGQTIANKEAYTQVINGLFKGNEEIRLDIQTTNNQYTVLTNETPNIIVDDIPHTKIQTGLDLRGGARALVQPDAKISDSEMSDLIEISRNRFNVYGLSDVQIRGVSDLSGNKFMLVEVAGATPSDLEDLVSKQGKFEAKVGNVSVFGGGKKDISDVCRNDATCAGIRQCDPVQGGYRCTFSFVIYLTEEAAQKHAEVTSNVPIDPSNSQYLSDKLYLYIDDQEVDSLLISADLKGKVTTQISIQGPGDIETTQNDAIKNAQDAMNKLQTVLITGSLPYKLTIEKIDTISPLLGKDFTNIILLAGAASILIVSLIIFIKYRRIKASLALLLTSFSELIIILGVAALIGWNLDLPSIAGILATIGTGVDQQIVILDEAEKGKNTSIKDRMKRARFVVLAAYFTSLVSLLPLYSAGAGLLKGFAITTIIGITAGVLITRPAFSDIIKSLEE